VRSGASTHRRLAPCGLTGYNLWGVYGGTLHVNFSVPKIFFNPLCNALFWKAPWR